MLVPELSIIESIATTGDKVPLGILHVRAFTEAKSADSSKD